MILPAFQISHDAFLPTGPKLLKGRAAAAVPRGLERVLTHQRPTTYKPNTMVCLFTSNTFLSLQHSSINLCKNLCPGQVCVCVCVCVCACTENLAAWNT